MPLWVQAGQLFFLFVAAAALAVPRLPARSRVRACVGAVGGLVLCRAIAAIAYQPIVHEWVAPPLVLLVAYWVSGMLFAGPMPRVEQVLERVDRDLAVDRIARVVPRRLADLLELSYAAIYVAIPLALALHVMTSTDPRPDRFWSVILITDFICFGCLALVQTRPPRARRTQDPWTSPLRRLNLQLLHSTSIQVNTFPSGHAAEALAAALLLSTAPWPAAFVMGVIAILVTASTVLGRYHYAADAIAGWIVAWVVWMFAAR
jgi:membrane-associated phospholipid phosphatase